MDVRREHQSFLTDFLWLPDSVFTLKGDSSSASRPARLDCVKASEQCLKEYSCSPKYRTMRQCVAGRESNFSAVTGPEAQGECRSAIEAMKQSPLYNCRCRRGMKKEKNCLRIFWSIFQSLQGNALIQGEKIVKKKKKIVLIIHWLINALTIKISRIQWWKKYTQIPHLSESNTTMRKKNSIKSNAFEILLRKDREIASAKCT